MLILANFEIVPNKIRGYTLNIMSIASLLIKVVCSCCIMDV